MHTTAATYLQGHHSPNHQVAFVTFQVQDTFEFLEGQFVMIEAQIGDKKIKKPYSIASTNHHMQESKQISFVVKKTSEDGMSHYLTQDIQEGNIVSLKGPVGHYVDSKQHKNYLLISTGSGLSPNVGLFQHLVYEKPTYENIVNIFGEKTQDDIIPELEELFTQHGQENITNYFHLSREELRKGYLSGHVQDSLQQAIDLLGTSTSCFICGAPKMVEDVRDKLEAFGIASEDITFEKY